LVLGQEAIVEIKEQEYRIIKEEVDSNKDFVIAVIVHAFCC
jgi:hypothetical protein